MDLSSALALAGATAALVAIPGPNVALIVANALARGWRFGAMTVLGTTLGLAAQLAIVVLGLAALLELAASTLIWLKWAGVAYLVGLGIQSWQRGTGDAMAVAGHPRPGRALVWQGALLALINPKTLLFNAAFLPQFVSAGAGPAALAGAAAIYLGVVFLGDLVWAASAGSAGPLLRGLGRLRHRLTGALFVGSGVALALSRVER